MPQLTGRVLDPSSPGWEAARRDFRLAVDYSKLIPKNVVFCQHVSDVQNAVRFARENGCRFARARGATATKRTRSSTAA